MWQHLNRTEGRSHLLHSMLAPACGALLFITLVWVHLSDISYRTIVPQPGQHQMVPFTNRALMRRHTRAHTHTHCSCSDNMQLTCQLRWCCCPHDAVQRGCLEAHLHHALMQPAIANVLNTLSMSRHPEKQCRGVNAAF